MKKIVKKTNLLILFLTTILVFNVSCVPSPSPQPEQDDSCEYQGFTYTDTSNNNSTSIPEAELTTELYNSGVAPTLEIYKTTEPGSMNFSTSILTEGESGDGYLNYNGTGSNVTVTCDKAGTAVGDEFRFSVTGTGFSAYFCVEIDQVH